MLGESEEEYGSEDNFDEAIMDLPSDEGEYSEDDVLYDEEDQEDGEEEESKWGKSKKAYYSADQDAVEEEAAEAKKLLTKKLSQMREEDFTGDKIIASGKSKKNKSGPVSLDISEEEEDGESYDEEEDEFELTEQQVVELSADEKIELLSKHSDEFKALVTDFKEKLSQLQNNLEPIIPKLAEAPTSEGLSFLKVKYQLLTAYCTNVAFYLKLKLSGKPVQDHPVLGKLVKFRLLLEKIKPLEAKLRHQVDRLLKAASGLVDSGDADATKFRPNPDMFVKQDDDGDEEEDEDNGGVYKAPKLAPMHYPEDESAVARREKHEAYLKKVNASNRLIQDIRAEFDDAPEEEALDVVYGSAKTKPGRRELAEREAYEEENFVRFTLDKKTKRRLKETAHKAIDELEDLNDFIGELDSSRKTKSNKKASKMVPSQLKQEPKPTKRPYLDDDESEIEDDMYAQAKAAKQAKKAKQSQPKPKAPVKFRPLVDMNDANGGGKSRPANWQMMKNKGLTPNRPKETKNPRVKQRMRFEKAEKRLGSFKAVNRAPTSKYSGEDSGIRSNLVRSTKF